MGRYVSNAIYMVRCVNYNIMSYSLMCTGYLHTVDNAVPASLMANFTSHILELTRKIVYIFMHPIDL